MQTSEHLLTLGQTGWFKTKYQPAATTLFAPHLLLVGQTGSGKSTTLKQISRQLQENRLGQIIFDPTGEFSRANDQQASYVVGKNVYFDLSQLAAEDLLTALDLTWPTKWQLLLGQAQAALRINYYLNQQQKDILNTQSLTTDAFYEQKSQLYKSQWTFSLSLLAPQLRLLARQGFADHEESLADTDPDLMTAIDQLADRLADLRLKAIAPNTQVKTTKYDLLYLLKLATAKADFGAKISINLAQLKDLGALQATIMSTVWRQLLSFQAQSTHKTTVYLLIDEGHRFLMKNNQADQDKGSGLAQILREGRKEGLLVAFASQSPLDLPTALLGQFSATIAHRLTNQNEWQSLPLLANSAKTGKKLGQLQTGQAIVKIGQKPSRTVTIFASKTNQ
ncbi:Archaeal DNA helicase HerA or a related bacterial ATPase [Fructobacillus cardui]|uniref:ATP-binding protein n=1 Tax=Fructobacillus cardui TaxID=2893170 RepID=UPI002DAD25E9|nr:Archaeal DNA helicase HerA or a related bacterial ATPase [Fructobacillus cardui]